jgi:hypothetical protein
MAHSNAVPDLRQSVDSVVLSLDLQDLPSKRPKKGGQENQAIGAGGFQDAFFVEPTVLL